MRKPTPMFTLKVIRNHYADTIAELKELIERAFRYEADMEADTLALIAADREKPKDGAR